MFDFENVVVGGFVEHGTGEPDAESYHTCATGNCTNLAVPGTRYCNPCLEFLRFALPKTAH